MVVGAGPAGSSAASAAAKKGLDVICIDKKRIPGNPVQCAEGIGSYLLNELPFSLPKHVFEWKIKGIIFNSGNISIKREGEFWEGYSVDRLKLESWLVKNAQRDGSKVLMGSELVDMKYTDDFIVSEVTIKRSSKEEIICPKVVIAADGVEATTLKIIDQYKPKKGALVDCHAWELENIKLKNKHFEEIYVGDFVPGGYGFIFPKSKSCANIGIGGLYPSKKIDKYFEEFTEEKEVRIQLEGAKWKKDKSRYAVFDYLCDKQIYGNVLLAGDVANHNFKPFVEGILPGIISGDLIGNLSEKIINEGFTEEQYTDIIDEVFSPFIKSSDIYKKLLHELYGNWGKKDHLMFISFISNLFEMERLDEFKEAELEVLEKNILLHLETEK